MKLKRTANAGILLTLDGVTILLDGVCREVKPYPTTPPEERERLMENWPQIVAFTHAHKDHYDPAYAAEFTKRTGRVVLGPESVKGSMKSQQVGNVTVTPIPSRHIGAEGKTTPHSSFIIEGSACLWFLGDAAPTQWKTQQNLPKPDVLLVPYAYANTPESWRITKSLGAKKILLLHMPEREHDTIGLWDGVREVTHGETTFDILPLLGEISYE